MCCECLVRLALRMALFNDLFTARCLSARVDGTPCPALHAACNVAAYACLRRTFADNCGDHAGAELGATLIVPIDFA